MTKLSTPRTPLLLAPEARRGGRTLTFGGCAILLEQLDAYNESPPDLVILVKRHMYMVTYTLHQLT